MQAVVAHENLHIVGKVVGCVPAVKLAELRYLLRGEGDGVRFGAGRGNFCCHVRERKVCESDVK